jgi:hypothetical protein
MINKKEIEKEFDKLLPKVDVVRIKAVFSNTKDEVSQIVAAETHNTQVEIVKQFIFKSITKVLDAVEKEYEDGVFLHHDEFKAKRKEIGF